MGFGGFGGQGRGGEGWWVGRFGSGYYKEGLDCGTCEDVEEGEEGVDEADFFVGDQ